MVHRVAKSWTRLKPPSTHTQAEKADPGEGLPRHHSSLCSQSWGQPCLMHSPCGGLWAKELQDEMSYPSAP